jgi:glycosyltransferase involved in cell wall biosynthesis
MEPGTRRVLISIMRITIVNPSRILGGTEYVYLMIAEKLARRGDEVVVVDVDNGWTNIPSIGNRICNAGICKVSLMSASWELGNADLILCSAKFVALVIRQGKVEGIDVSERLLAWLLHPLELFSNQFRAIKRVVGIFDLNFVARLCVDARLSKLTGYSGILRRLIANDRLHPMDETTALGVKKYFPDLSPVIYPVPNNAPAENVNKCRFVYGEKKIFSIVWISRLDGFKLPPLIKLLGDLARSKHSIPQGVRVTVIGDGNGLNALQEYARSLPDFIEVEFKGFMPTVDLERHLINESIDLAVGMGTALSLCAACGIPSVIATAADDIADYAPGSKAFRFLGSRRSFSLGEYQNSKPDRFEYFTIDRILAHASALPSIGAHQEKWYRKTYGRALEDYVAKIYEVAASTEAAAKCSGGSSVVSRIAQAALLKIVYKNAAFPP